MANYKETLLTESNRTARKLSFNVAREVVNVPREGLGINITLDSQAKGCYPTDEKGWQALLALLEELSPSWLCITLPAQEVLTAEGKLRKDVPELNQFDKLCKWATLKQLDVVLMFPKSVPEWMRFQKTSGHQPAPCDTEIYAEVIAEAMNYFVHECGYTCLKYSTIFGEPFNEDGEEFSFGTPDGIDPYAYYAKLHAAVRKALDGKRLSSVGLLGPNSADVYAHIETFKRSEERGLNLVKDMSAIDLHAYRMRLDYMPPSQHVFTCGLTEYLEQYLGKAIEIAKENGKPCYITELGCMYYGKSRYGDNRGPSRHECFIAEAELIIRSMNIGIDGILKWVLLFDTSELRGHYHLLEFRDGTYQKRDNYYGFSLLNRAMPKGSKILKVSSKGDSNGIYPAVSESPDGNLSLMIVNNHPTDLADVEIQLPQDMTDKRFRHWNVDYWDKGVPKGTVVSENGILRVRLTPLSLSVITNAEL
jgi:hypothetical protein